MSRKPILSAEKDFGTFVNKDVISLVQRKDSLGPIREKIIHHLSKKEFRMNKQSKQNFLTLFNDMLSGSQGRAALERVLKLNDKGDEIDLINTQQEQSLKMRLDQRNILFLKKVEEAKQKILDGTYGECEECGADISQKRLLARPMAHLCINCQEQKERNEWGHFSKRRDLDDKRFSEDEDSNSVVKKSGFSKVSDIVFESVVDL